MWKWLEFRGGSGKEVWWLIDYYYYYKNLTYTFTPQIREETDTKIDLPRENSMSDVIIITGKKENVEKAKKLIQKIQTEMVGAVVCCVVWSVCVCGL